MRKLLTLFFAVIAMVAVTNSQDISSSIAPLYDGPVWGSIADTGITCSGGPLVNIIRDDGSYENGYRSVSTGDSTTMVQKMVMPSAGFQLQNMCVTWTALSPGGNITFDLIIYDTTGAGGTPGNVVYRVNSVVANAVGIFPAHTRYTYPINFATTQRAYYVGVRWNNNPILPQFFSADENGPVSTMGPGYQRLTTTYPPVFTDVTLAFPLWKSWGVRLEGSAGGSDIRPELMYYKFENNPSPTLVQNCAKTPVGTNPAPLLASTPFGSGGQFDSCLSGITTPGVANLGGVNTGWLTVMPANWTIGFWMGAGVVDGNPSYLFGDPGASSFRCFYGGAAGANSILLRGFGADILITGVGTTAVVITITYDGTNVIVYKNGVVFGTFPRVATLTTGTGFRVGSYNTTAVSHFIGKLDEFRLYNRALNQAEVTATWNSDLGGCGITGIQNTNNQIPNKFSLEQNYPNPFNPTTNIKFAIPSTGLVKLVIFDILGREVETLVNEVKVAGNYTVDFNASALSSGVYFYRIEAGNFTMTKKMLLVK
jgi:hypothetical protein